MGHWKEWYIGSIVRVRAGTDYFYIVLFLPVDSLYQTVVYACISQSRA